MSPVNTLPVYHSTAGSLPPSVIQCGQFLLYTCVLYTYIHVLCVCSFQVSICHTLVTHQCK